MQFCEITMCGLFLKSQYASPFRYFSARRQSPGGVLFGRADIELRGVDARLGLAVVFELDALIRVEVSVVYNILLALKALNNLLDTEILYRADL